ncbi:MAG: LLM class flavin-dependent oxidoreductase [Candidatus Rokubacteria bacterium]|nr:LLM class flavin-dependent oxidoreductase [Candidatus Rokubacteria bacterium]
MKLGVALPVAGAWATPENQVRVARTAERLGYHSVWVFQRLLYALEPKNEYPPVPGPVWPKAFERVVDPIVTLAYVAAATSRVRLGTSVLLMPYYTPVMLAKQLATLDLVSKGRLDVGLGLGWSQDEYDAVGVPYRQRGRRGDEFLRALKAIWTQDIVEFEGEFYRTCRSRRSRRSSRSSRPPRAPPAAIRRRSRSWRAARSTSTTGRRAPGDGRSGARSTRSARTSGATRTRD